MNLSVILAILAGISLGYVLERGDMCFHSTLRGLFRSPKQIDLFRAYILALSVMAPLVYLFRELNWISPWVPPFVWPANLTGGLIFGTGMVVASSCITGYFYKLGHGMLGVLVGIIGWAIGDIAVYVGPLAGIHKQLTSNPITISGSNPTVIDLVGAAGYILILVLSLGALIWFWRSAKSARLPDGKHWNWPKLGIAAGLVISIGWLLARAGNSNYPFGTSYVPTQIYRSLIIGERSSSWIPITLVSLILGAFIAAQRSGTLWVRGESIKRYFELAAGGLLMGAGAAFAGGCNLGHGLVGAGLLSIGSIVTVLAMIAGVFLADRTIQIFSRQRSEHEIAHH